MGGLERYTRSKNHIADLPKDMIEVVVIVARKKFIDNPGIQTLKNLRKNPSYEHIVRDYIDEVDSD